MKKLKERKSSLDLITFILILTFLKISKHKKYYTCINITTKPYYNITFSIHKIRGTKESCRIYLWLSGFVIVVRKSTLQCIVFYCSFFCSIFRFHSWINRYYWIYIHAVWYQRIWRSFHKGWIIVLEKNFFRKFSIEIEAVFKINNFTEI